MFFEVGYQFDDSMYSINLIEAKEIADADAEAQKRADKFGYKVAYCNAVNESYAEEMKRKGMPVIKLC